MQSLLQKVFSYDIHPSGSENKYIHIYYIPVSLYIDRWKLLGLLISTYKFVIGILWVEFYLI